MASKQALGVPRALDAEELVVVVHAPELLLPADLKVVGLVEVGPGPRGVLAELVQGLVSLLRIMNHCRQNFENIFGYSPHKRGQEADSLPGNHHKYPASTGCSMCLPEAHLVPEG